LQDKNAAFHGIDMQMFLAGSWLSNIVNKTWPLKTRAPCLEDREVHVTSLYTTFETLLIRRFLGFLVTIYVSKECRQKKLQ
jgi:hypothetical protein